MRNASAHLLNAGSHTPPAAPILQTRPSPVVPSPVQRLPSRSNARPFVPGTPDTNALANGTAAQSVAAESSDWQPIGGGVASQTKRLTPELSAAPPNERSLPRSTVIRNGLQPVRFGMK